KWLCMMYPRLTLLHQLLADDGAIFISIDDNEQANLKLLCDEIFGSGNFVTQIAWKRKKEISNDSKNVAIQGEYILCYSKSSLTQLNFENLSDEYIGKSYKKPSNDFPTDFWRPVPLTVSKGLSGGGYEYSIQTPTGKIHTKIWAYPQYRYEELLKQNRIYFGKDGNGIPQRVMYLSESQGKPTSNYWDDTSSNKDGKKEILSIFYDENIFSTPKPTGLIKRILQLLSPDSIILDSFAGSGTTAHAVLNLNKQDGGNRKFILVEMEDYAETITAERVKRVIKGYGEGKNAVEGTGGSFSYYELGEPIMNGDYINENQPVEKIKEYIWYCETHTACTTLSSSKYYLGKHNNAGYYFYYEKNSTTTLDKQFLNTINESADQYIIYADNCLLNDEFMRVNHIVFKKIPRDIRKF
ncbi:MAG: site-specific DNA-methyltransferase, partial [Paludibacteraceae bacterium]|nr:site-specific DNA-methyltransferase [Paludibacteraceae bacterium]